jgi:CheY-like chemotaxis protein
MRKHVLVCDDDIDIIEIVTLLLEKEGHQVSAVRDCESIWEVIEAKTPDLIFMDLWMQKMGGEATTRLLKKNQDTRKIPVILLSASKGIEEAAQRAGADGFLAKPF